MIRSLALIALAALALTPHAAQAKAPVVVGAIQPLTGWASLDGHNVYSGMKIALAKINATGGVLGGRDMKIIIEDGKADPVESVNAAQKLINRDKVPAIMGCWASSATLAVMPVVKRARVPLLVSVSTAPMITGKKNQWVFRFTSSNDVDGELMAKYLVPKLGFKKAAYLAVNKRLGTLHGQGHLGHHGKDRRKGDHGGILRGQRGQFHPPAHPHQKLQGRLHVHHHQPHGHRPYHEAVPGAGHENARFHHQRHVGGKAGQAGRAQGHGGRVFLRPLCPPPRPRRAWRP